jgi:hypothetical protein
MDSKFNAQWRDYSQHLREQALRAVSDLETATGEGDKELLVGLLDEVTAFLDDPRLTTQFFSKVSSLRDQAAIFQR